MDQRNYTNYSNSSSQNDDNSSQKKNRRRVISIVLLVLVFITAFSIAMFVLFGRPEENSDSQNETPVVSEENLQQNLTELDITTQDAQSATRDLMETLDSYDKQLKVSE